MKKTVFHTLQSLKLQLCLLGFSCVDRTLVVHSLIDNLVKGASGQAIQAANCWFEFDETLGLPVSAQVL